MRKQMKRKELREWVLEVGETGERRGERAGAGGGGTTRGHASEVGDDEDRKYLLASNASSLPPTTRIEHLKCPYFDHLRNGLSVCGPL